VFNAVRQAEIHTFAPIDVQPGFVKAEIGIEKLNIYIYIYREREREREREP
jgi:hypothetical protein